MKYHAHLTPNQHINSLPTNPCQLLNFNFLKLGAGEEYTTNTGSREIFAVILEGKAKFTINGTNFEKIGGCPSVFGGKPQSVYIPAGRWGEAADLKRAAVFLASAASDYMQGAVVPVDGGWLCR